MLKIRLTLIAVCIFLSLSSLVSADKSPLSRGYLLVQFLSTNHESNYGAISTEEEADTIFSKLKGKVNGLEYFTLHYNKRDLEIHKTIAERAKRYGIDIWLSSWKLLKQFKTFGGIPPEFRAYVMHSDGTIVPAFVDNEPLFDVLNPDAVKWFLIRYRKDYLEPMKGMANGFFFNEDTIPYLGSRKNELRFDYWNNASFSPAVLKAWRKYCIKNNIRNNGRIVDKFPVHKITMVMNGKGMTEYFPGYDVPEKIYPGQRFVDLPKTKGIWKNWYDFLSGQFLLSWLGQLAHAANAVNRNNPEWHGVMYFGLHQWTLSYENIQNPDFRVPKKHNLGAWGLHRGIDLFNLSRHPEINILACETLPPIDGANLESFVKEFKKVIDGSGKTFGLMLHRDDRWKLDPGEEKRRWELINKYKPQIILRYKRKNMLPGGEYFDPKAETLFLNQLEKYRTSL